MRVSAVGNLRKLAKGRDCQVRLPCCNGDPATVVLAHLRMTGLSGMGIKAEDIFGCYACSMCHNYCDTHHDVETQLAFAKAIFRTQNDLIKEGVITW
jgi:hypothetical protein